MRVAVADCRIDKAIERSLLGYADKLIKLPPFPALAAPVASHPDMLLWSFERVIVTHEDYSPLAKAAFDELGSLGYEIRFSRERVTSIYPEDIRLNCAVVGRHVIANTKYASQTIADVAKRNGLLMLDVKQGYAKCSTVCVGNNSIITADTAIARKCQDAGIDALEVSHGSVRLDGYDTGFIGGASGATDKEVLFCGDISAHPDGEKIKELCQAHGKVAVSLANTPLYDYGTIFFFDN